MSSRNQSLLPSNTTKITPERLCCSPSLEDRKDLSQLTLSLILIPTSTTSTTSTSNLPISIDQIASLQLKSILKGSHTTQETQSNLSPHVQFERPIYVTTYAIWYDLLYLLKHFDLWLYRHIKSLLQLTQDADLSNTLEY